MSVLYQESFGDDEYPEDNRECGCNRVVCRHVLRLRGEEIVEVGEDYL